MGDAPPVVTSRNIDTDPDSLATHSMGEAVEGEAVISFDTLDSTPDAKGGDAHEGESPDAKAKREADEAAAAKAKQDKADKLKEQKQQQQEESPEAKTKRDEAEAAAAKLQEDEKLKAKLQAPPPEDDKDIDTLQLKQNASPKSQEQFEALRKIAKEERRRSREIEARAKELEARAKDVKPLDEKTATELEDLRKFKRTFDIENDDSFKAEYDAKLTTVDTNILGSLQALGMPAEHVEAIKKNGLDSYSWDWWQENVFSKLVGKPKFEFEGEKIKQKLFVRDELLGARKAAIVEAKQNADTILQQRSEGVKKAWEGWGKQVETEVKTITANVPWAQEKVLPADATADVKAAVEAHNTKYKVREALFKKTIDSVIQQHPADVARLGFVTVENDVLKEEVTGLGRQITAKDERIKELEEQLAARNNAGRVSRASAPPPAKDKSKSPADNLGKSADQAMEEFFAGA